MAKIPFPDLTPSRRSFRPGRKSITTFQSQNGATTFIEFGNRFIDAEMDMEFANISDDNANLIYLHYESIQENDSVTFNESRGLAGIGGNLRSAVESVGAEGRQRLLPPPVASQDHNNKS